MFLPWRYPSVAATRPRLCLYGRLNDKTGDKWSFADTRNLEIRSVYLREIDKFHPFPHSWTIPHPRIGSPRNRVEQRSPIRDVAQSPATEPHNSRRGCRAHPCILSSILRNPPKLNRSTGKPLARWS